MVLLLLVGSLLVAAVRAVSQERRAVAAHRLAVQADLLAEAGLRRGRRWAADPAFTTRDWAVPGDALDGDPATVTVTADRTAGTLRSVAVLTGGRYGDAARVELTAPLPTFGEGLTVGEDSGVGEEIGLGENTAVGATVRRNERPPTRTPLEAPR